MGGDVFAWVMVGVFAFLVLFVLALGAFYPGTGAEQLRWKPTRSSELEAQNEIDDLAEMLEATNAKRRARGAGALTEETMHERIREDRRLREQLRRRAEGASAEEDEPEAVRQARDAMRRRREDGA